MIFNIKFALDVVPEIMSALPLTLWMTVVSITVGLLIGFLFAYIKMRKIPVLTIVLRIIFSILEGVPLMIQLYIVYYGIPFALARLSLKAGREIDLANISPFALAVVALSLNYSVYFSEMTRSAICAVEKGQIEAAYSIGYTKLQTMFRVILPQAAVIALPNFGNLCITVFKATSLTYAISIVEIMGQARIVANRGFDYIEAYTVATCMYWIINIIFEMVLKWIERKKFSFS